MRPVKTISTNHNFGPPRGKEGQIGDLPCEFPVRTEHGTFVYAVYELSDEDRRAIANGYNIRLGIGWLGAFPPVSLGVTHETRISDEAEVEKEFGPEFPA